MIALLSRAPWVGLITGPFAWAVSTQLNNGLAEWACRHHQPNPIPWIALALATVAALGAARSWRIRVVGDIAVSRTQVFIADLAALTGALFAVAILTQGAAGLVFTACAR